MFSFTSMLDLAAGSFLIGAAILATGWLYFEFIPKRIAATSPKPAPAAKPTGPARLIGLAAGMTSFVGCLFAVMLPFCFFAFYFDASLPPRFRLKTTRIEEAFLELMPHFPTASYIGASIYAFYRSIGLNPLVSHVFAVVTNVVGVITTIVGGCKYAKKAVDFFRMKDIKPAGSVEEGPTLTEAGDSRATRISP